MTNRPACLVLVDGYVAGAMIAHEYAYGLHRKLVEMGADDDHTHELVRKSAAVVLERIPVLTRRLRCLEREWDEQQLLDPSAAERTVKRLEGDVVKLAPELAALSDRQKQIVAELLDLVSRAR